MVCCSPEPRRVGTSFSGLNQNVTNLAIAIVTTNACTNKVLHLNYNGRARRHAQGHNRSQSSMAVAKCLLSRSSAPKGGMVGKTICRATTKPLFEMESELAEERFPRLSGEPLNRFPPSGFTEQRGVVTCRNASCLKLGVRQRKRSFSLGGVCDPVFYLSFAGGYR